MSRSDGDFGNPSFSERRVRRGDRRQDTRAAAVLAVTAAVPLTAAGIHVRVQRTLVDRTASKHIYRTSYISNSSSQARDGLVDYGARNEAQIRCNRGSFTRQLVFELSRYPLRAFMFHVPRS